MPDKHYVTVKAAVWKGDKLLLQKEHHEGGLVYSMPGGRINKGEDIREALRREVKEELGVELSWMSDLPVKVFTTVGAGDGIVGLVYEAKLASEDFHYEPEVESAAFVSRETVAKSPSYVHTPSILQYFDEHLNA